MPQPVLSVLALLVVGAAAAAEAPDPASLTHLVLHDCGSCHGMTLRGGLGSDLRPDSLAHYSPESLRLVILDGIPGTAMPPWRPLISDDEARWIAEYLLKGETP